MTKKRPLSWDKAQRIGKQYNVDPYILYGTIENVNSGMNQALAFARACENENYYGKRSDNVAHRLRAAVALRQEYKLTRVSDEVARDTDAILK